MNRKRGEGYIDVVVSLLVTMMLVAVTLQVFSFLTLKQDMDYFAGELLAAAATEGTTAVEERYRELCEETGLSPAYDWDADYFDGLRQAVQYGEVIRLTLTVQSKVEGVGVFHIPVTLTASRSGLSQRYWKEGG